MWRNVYEDIGLIIKDMLLVRRSINEEVCLSLRIRFLLMLVCDYGPLKWSAGCPMVTS